ncbi:ATP-binding protein [Spirillospora sp. CA-294931]|uniref:ATP-binding protein n=1 Tax=Spirillospora sp. CA-294931 TaxID=3240042 RepID=UPI003D93823E
MVQARDVTGGIHIHTGASVASPRQLPEAVRLVNRADELEVLDRLGGGGGSGTIVVSGPPGIGKSAMALRWAHDKADSFTDGQLYADLQGHAAAPPALPGEVLAGFIRGLGVPSERIPAALEERAALYRTLSADRRLLVVLDDAYSAAQVAPLLPGAAGSVAVVTSRWRLAGLVARGAHGLQLEPLDSAAALDLLGGMLGLERLDSNRADVGDLAELCAGSPLALTLVAARLATRPNRPFAEMVRALTDERQRLSMLAVRDAHEVVTVRAALAVSYERLPGTAQRMYRLLGLYPGVTFGAHAAAALTATEVPQATEAIELLADSNLLDDAPGGRFRLHALVRLHARELADELEPARERDEAVRRLGEWHLRAVRAASDAVAPYRRLAELPSVAGIPPSPVFDTPRQGLDWLDEEFVNLRAIAKQALDFGYVRQCWMLVDGAWPLFPHRGHHAERLAFDRIGLEAARLDRHREAEAKMLNRTGLALRVMGRLDEAATDFNAALALWREEGNDSRIASASRRLGLLERDRGDLDSALAHYTVAVESYRAHSEPRRVARALCDLGAVLIAARRTPDAVEALTEAGRLLDAEQDPHNQARVLVLLSRARTQEGELAAAADLATRGLERMREIGSATGEADALIALSELDALAGRQEDADQRRARARQILAGMGTPARIINARLAELDPPR